MHVDDLGVGRLPHTYLFAYILLGDKTKHQGPYDDEGYLAYLLGKLSSRLGFFNENNHIILVIIRF